jgi:glycine/D-amino acid oxidase-like deaminating enzyme
VCIVGAGYTGLWTAWALACRDPGLRIVIVEAQHAGFGASGRNGGWLSGLLPGNRERLARTSEGRVGGGRAGVIALQRQLIRSVGDVIEACSSEGIGADICVGGTLAVATTVAQWRQLQAALVEDRRWGLGPDDEWELAPEDVIRRVRVADTVGGTFSPHCARIQPAKLARGLAEAVCRRGVTIYEHTPAVGIAAGWVHTTRGNIRAPWVVRATEGFTAQLAGLKRALLPMNSSMIVTEPLGAEVWERIGWAGHETIRDGAHVYVYAQRTADGRVAIGGRGIPYRFGSRVDDAGRTPPITAQRLSAALQSLLPGLGSPDVTHVWSGVLGVARDWCPAVGVARSAEGGLAWAGGYVGDGVTTSHLAGCTLADLVLGRATERTTLPWVGHASRDWEPEPLRWLGVRAVYALYRAADRAERRRPGRNRSSRWADAADRLAGRA